MAGFNQEAAEASLALIKQGMSSGERSRFSDAGMKMTTAIGFLGNKEFPKIVKELYAHFSYEIGLHASTLNNDKLIGLNIREEFVDGARLMYAAYAQEASLREELHTEEHVLTASSVLCGAVHEGAKGVLERRKSSRSESEY